MIAGLDPLALATDAQRRPSPPGHSAWVQANAGTGKTKVLTDRVTRLLLDGAKPERILCLTFTKAAAAEMRNRLASQLGRWALASNAEIDQEIAALNDRPPRPEERIGARRLFARVLDAPGGINILTIHAFCQALLKRFPLEAGVAPGFEVLKGAWVRPDGGYMIAINGVGPDGRLDAPYFNPKELPFATAQASREGTTLRVFLELTAGGYSGSTYELTYEPASDRLRGTYYQAVAKQKFDVNFARK